MRGASERCVHGEDDRVRKDQRWGGGGAQGAGYSCAATGNWTSGNAARRRRRSSQSCERIAAKASRWNDMRGGRHLGIVRTRSGVELITKGMCSTGPKAFVLQAPLARCSGVLDDTSQGACVSRNRPSELWSPPRGSVDPARERGRGRRDLGAHSVTSIERPRLGVPVQGNREGFACPAPLAAPPTAPLAACAACRLASMRVP